MRVLLTTEDNVAVQEYGDITRIRLSSEGLSKPGTGGGVAVGAGAVWVA